MLADISAQALAQLGEPLQLGEMPRADALFRVPVRFAAIELRANKILADFICDDAGYPTPVSEERTASATTHTKSEQQTTITPHPQHPTPDSTSAR